uniref:Secreted protein n=1 Tax=Strongyloides venezuelensis TaxID=75913 RepID=A0A0K0FLD5_STRVS
MTIFHSKLFILYSCCSRTCVPSCAIVQWTANLIRCVLVCSYLKDRQLVYVSCDISGVPSVFGTCFECGG